MSEDVVCPRCDARLAPATSFCPFDGASLVRTDADHPGEGGEALAGRYVAEDVVGEGLVGVVYRVRDPESDARYAAKLFRPVVEFGSDASARLLTDVERVAALAHPGLVSAVDVDLHADTCLLLVEPLMGSSLSARLASQGPLGAAEAIRLATGLADALGALHAIGLVHADLKPENVFLEDGAPLLAAAGTHHVLALDQAADDAPGTCLTWSEYLAPELVLGEQPGPATDVYLLGGLIHEMLTGRPPFHSAAAGPLPRQHVEAAPPRLRELAKKIPAGLEALVLRCLEKAPAARFASGADVAEALRALAAELGVAVPPPPVMAPPPAEVVPEDEASSGSIEVDGADILVAEPVAVPVGAPEEPVAVAPEPPPEVDLEIDAGDVVEEVALEAPPAEESPAEELPVEASPAEAPPAEEPPADEIPAEEPPAEEPPAEEPPAEEPPAEEPPAGEPPAADAAAETASPEEAPSLAAEPPAEEPPAEEPPAEEPPAEEPPAEEPPAEEPPAEEPPAEPEPFDPTAALRDYVEAYVSGAAGEEVVAELEGVAAEYALWPALAEVYAAVLAEVDDVVMAADLRRRLGRVLLDELDAPAEAAPHFEAAYATDDTDLVAVAALERIREGEQDWPAVLRLLERRLALTDDDGARSALALRIAALHEEQLDDPDAALAALARRVAEAPGDRAAVEAQERICLGLERWDALAQVLTHKARQTDRLEQRQELRHVVAALYDQELGDAARAAAAYEEILADDPDDAPARDALVRLYEQLERWRPLVDLLWHQAEAAAEPADRVAALTRVAELCESRLADPAGAIDARARLLGEQPDDADAYGRLATLLEAEARWADVAALRLERLERTADAEERLALLVSTAVLLEQQLARPEHALVALCRAFRETRDEARFGPDLARLAEATDRWSDLVDAYEAVIEALGEVPEAAPLHARIAPWYEARLGARSLAREHYEAALRLRPDDLEALRGLAALHEAAENLAGLADVLAREAEVLPDAEARLDALRRLGRLQADRLGDADAAAVTWRRVLDAAEGDPEALRALARLFARGRRWADLLDLFDRQLAVLTEPAARLRNRLDVAELWRVHLDDPDRAIAAYREALAIDPESPDALTQLETLLEQRERWPELLEVYQRLLAAEPAPAEQRRLHLRIAAVHADRLDDRHAAVASWRAALALDPGDAEAAAALEATWRADERWADLADLYTRRIPALSGEAAIEVRSTLADLCQDELDDPARAVAALTPILEEHPEHTPTLERLGHLYAELGDWHAAIDAISREAALLTDPAALVERHDRVGRIYLDELQDLAEAERWYEVALMHDPTDRIALESLKTIHARLGDWEAVVGDLRRIEDAAQTLAEEAACLYEMGVIYEERLRQPEPAMQCYEEAAKLDPEHADTARRLLPLYWQAEAWERLAPLLDLLLGQTLDDIGAAHRLHFQRARCAERLKHDDLALEHYRRAYELDCTDLETLRGLAGALHRRHDWDGEFKTLQALKVHHRERLSNQELVETLHRQGAIKEKLGENPKAIEFYRKALQHDGVHRPTLEALVSLHERRGDWEDVVSYRRRMLPLLASDRERFQSLVGIGDLLAQQLARPRLSVQAYQEALALQPDSRLVLSKLLELHEAAERWDDTIRVLERLAELETDTPRKAKYLYAIALIQRDSLKDRHGAIDTFERALDVDPTMLHAFRALDELLTADRDYERQDACYRKMLERALRHGMGEAVVLALARNLGEINRTRLKRMDQAIEAYELVLQRAPDDVQTHEMLVELHELSGHVDHAITHHRRLLELEPQRVESYRALYRLFRQARRLDEAWCVCQVLLCLGRATAEEAGFFERARPRTLMRTRRALSRELWVRLVHPKKSPHPDQVFLALYPYVVPQMAVSHRDLQVHKRRDQIDPNADHPFNHVLNYLAQTMGLPRPPCFRAPPGFEGVRPVNFDVPSLLVSDSAGAWPPEMLAFDLSRQLYLMGRQTFVALLDDHLEIRKSRLLTLLHTASALLDPRYDTPFCDKPLLGRLKNLSAPERHVLGEALQRIHAEPATHLNMAAWLELLEHSANRLGLLLCNDLGVAVTRVQQQSDDFSGTPAAERIRELVVFAISEDYFALRKALGLAVG